MKTDCPFGANIKVAGGEVTATPTNPEEIGEVVLGGTMRSTIGNFQRSRHPVRRRPRNIRTRAITR
jgi:hypothetical protein